MARYAIEAQRDTLAGTPEGASGATWYEACEEGRATLWAVFDTGAGTPGPALVADFPSRALAQALCDGLAIADASQPRDPLADLSPSLRAYLVAEMGMKAELAGGGSVQLRRDGGSAGHILVTGADGSDLPTGWDGWMVGAYGPEDHAEALWCQSSADRDSCPTLRQAVVMAWLCLLNRPGDVEPETRGPGVVQGEGGAFYIMTRNRELAGPFATYDAAERLADECRRHHGTAWVDERPARLAQFATPGDVAHNLADALEELALCVRGGNPVEKGTPLAIAMDNARNVLSRMGVNIDA